MADQFLHVRGLKPRRSRFNVGYMKGYDCDMGQIIPSMVKYMVPGDIFRFTQEVVARAIVPPKAPAMAEINVHTSCFFVPLRILFGETKYDKDGWPEWEIHDHDFEKFITGGHSGNDNTVVLPRWVPQGVDVVNDNWNGLPESDNDSNVNYVNVSVKDNGKYSLWDYFEMPTNVIPDGAFPLDFWRRAYYLIYNEWFRDENVMPPVDILTENRVMNCCWKKDYFTSMLPWPQRGDPIAIPLRGNADVDLNFPAQAPIYAGVSSLGDDFSISKRNVFSGISSSNNLGTLYSNNDSDTGNSVAVLKNALGLTSVRSVFADLTGITGSAALSMAATFTVNDLRLAFQLQRWQELNARIGSRYVEFLKGTYGVSPTDDTLQRPMFVGGYKSPVIISEVLQTSNGGEGVGSMSGHAIVADGNFVTKFRANEFGILMALTYIKPKAMYHQGIDRENLYRSRYEFYHPAMVNLGEQAVEQAELYATNSDNVDASGDPKILGYQGRFNELRSSHNKICGGLRDQLSYWVSLRNFGNAPVLNGQFLKCNPSKEMFGVLDDPAFIVMVNNKIPAYRPLPVDPQPGLIDHLYGERR